MHGFPFVTALTLDMVGYSSFTLKALRNCQSISPVVRLQLKSLNILKTRRNCYKRLHNTSKPMPIRTRISQDLFKSRKINQRQICTSALRSIPLTRTLLSSQHCIKFCVINARSVKNKTTIISELISDIRCDCLALTETWLKTGDEETVLANELCPSGYSFKHLPRPDDSGFGGIGLVFRDSLCVKVKHAFTFSSFEIMYIVLSAGSQSMHIYIIYRPPPSCKNGHTFAKFIEEFQTMIEQVSTTSSQFIITGDLNVHFDSVTSAEAKKVISVIQAANMQQLVSAPTHRCGHILDPVITSSTGSPISLVQVDDHLISDHFLISTQFALDSPTKNARVLKYRQYSKVNLPAFYSAIADRIATVPTSLDSTKQILDFYNSTLRHVLDQHAPERSKLCSSRHSSPWMNDEIREKRIERRKAERRWRKTKLQSDRINYRLLCCETSRVIKQRKMQFYNSKIAELSGDQSALFNLVNRLSAKSAFSEILPDNNDAVNATNFASFFSQKVDMIRVSIGTGTQNPVTAIKNAMAEPPPPMELSYFKQCDCYEIVKIIQKSKSTTCDLDPAPTSFVKLCANILAPTISALCNQSFTEDLMPGELKTAIVRPKLKKLNTDRDELKHYRPVSNIAFLGKIIERVVLTRLSQHLESNGLNELYQSAYKPNHSTESTLLRVQNDILTALDDKKCIVLVLLDLSAAFDTIDHEVLLSRLQSRIGIVGKALKWLTSYIKNRSYLVQVHGEKSSTYDVKFGVPQGSVLGPILFCIYMLPLGDILRRHKVQFHQYADDLQLYLSFSSDNHQAVVSKIENCVEEVQSWLETNFLKMNKDKTEIMFIRSKRALDGGMPNSLKICGEQVEVTSALRNLGAVFDSHMTMENNVMKVCQSANFQLRKIAFLKGYLTQDSLRTLVQSFVISRIDYSNSLLVGLPEYQLQRLQRVQNHAARVIAGTAGCSSVTQTLMALHWLPVRQRIVFKLACFVYKVLNGLAPSYLDDLVTSYQPSRALRSAEDKTLIAGRKTRTTAGDRAFSAAAPSVWNALPRGLREAPTYTLFRKHLKTHLFKVAYNIHN